MKQLLMLALLIFCLIFVSLFIGCSKSFVDKDVKSIVGQSWTIQPAGAFLGSYGRVLTRGGDRRYMRTGWVSKDLRIVTTTAINIDKESINGLKELGLELPAAV